MSDEPTHTSEIDTYTFNDFIGVETLEREYKEFTLHNTGLLIDYKLAVIYCKNKKFKFNDLVIKNLKKYTNVYFPKYVCGFLNSDIKGELYIGVNDYGFIRGIPFHGELDILTIKQNMIDVITKSLKNNLDIKFDINKLVNIDIVKIEHPPEPTGELPETFIKYLELKLNYEQKYQQFVQNMTMWKNKMKYYVQKLTDIVNNEDSRKILIDYIKTHDETSNAIKILESDYIMEYRDHGEINILKYDTEQPYYWVCRWKDEMIDMMKSIKPTFNDVDCFSATPYNIIVGVSEMIPYWLHNNSDMNLYVVKVSVNKISDIYCLTPPFDITFSYLTHDEKKWTSCYRNVLSNGDPVCTPY
jgi:hypothetical protein